MATNEKSSEAPPPSYRDATAPTYPQPLPMPMPQSMSSPIKPTMSSPMHQPMLQPMPPPMQQAFYPSGGVGVDHTNQPITVSPGHQDWRPMQQTFSPPGSFLPRLPTHPTTLVCPTCKNQIVTRVEHRISLRTHIIAAMCCLMGCCLCMWIPYFNNTFKIPEHYCPTCNTYLGSCIDFKAEYLYDY